MRVWLDAWQVSGDLDEVLDVGAEVTLPVYPISAADRSSITEKWGFDEELLAGVTHRVEKWFEEPGKTFTRGRIESLTEVTDRRARSWRDLRLRTVEILVRPLDRWDETDAYETIGYILDFFPLGPASSASRRS